MTNITSTQQEKARAEFETAEVYKRIVAMDMYCQLHGWKPPAEGDTVPTFLDSLISSTVTAVLDGVKEVMPEEKNYTDKFAACWNCGKYNYSCECESAYNECRTALLKSLEEMEGKGV